MSHFMQVTVTANIYYLCFFKENQKLKKDLLEAQTNIAFLQSELDSLKSEYADQTLNTER